MAAGRDNNADSLGLSGYPSSSDDDNDESQRNTLPIWLQPQVQTSRDREEMRERNDIHDARRQRNSSLSGQEIHNPSLLSGLNDMQENAAGRRGKARTTINITRKLVDINGRRRFSRDPLIFARGSVVHEPVIDLREPPPRPSASADIQDIMEFRRLAYSQLNSPRPLEFQMPQQSSSSRTRSNPALAGYGRNNILSSVTGGPYGLRLRLGRRSAAAPSQSGPSSAGVARPSDTDVHPLAQLLAASPSPPPAQDRQQMDDNQNDYNNQHYQQEADTLPFEPLSFRLIAEQSDNNPDNLDAGENANRVSSPPVEELVGDPGNEPSDIPVGEPSDMPIDLSDEIRADESADEPSDRTADDSGDRPNDRATNELNERPTEQPSDSLVDEPDNRPVGGDDMMLTNVNASGSEVMLISNSNTYGESRTANDSIESQTPSRRNKRKRQSGEANSNNDPSDVMDFNEKLLHLLECPVCMEWIEPPMWQCRRGHLVCGRCRAQLSVCPVCRTGFSSVRNRAMEGVAELLRYPCPHGCGRRARLRRRSAHEASCKARCYRCPAPACAPAPPYPLTALIVHLQRAHAAMIKTGQKHHFSVKLNTQLHEDWVLMVDSGLFHLRLDVELRFRGIVLSVAYIGPKCLAKDYNYEVTVVGQHNGRKLVYSRAVHSDLECSSLTLSRQDCFHLTLDAAVNYLRVRNKSCERDRMLDLTVEITKREAATADNSSVIVSDD